MSDPDIAVLTVSWELALRADGYADNTVKAVRKAVQSLADWLAEHRPEVGRPSWIASTSPAGWSRSGSATPATRPEGGSPGPALLPLAGARGRGRSDATAGTKTPAPGDPETPVLSAADLRALLATCVGTDSGPGFIFTRVNGMVLHMLLCERTAIG